VCKVCVRYANLSLQSDLRHDEMLFFMYQIDRQLQQRQTGPKALMFRTISL